MKNVLYLLFIVTMAGLTSPPFRQLQRLPLEKKKYELKSPASWEKRLLKIDPQTSKETYYDPRPRIELFDAKALKYYLKWIGYDGKEKTIIYQRRDCVDIVVDATTTMSSTGIYEYEYIVRNLESSGDFLNGFMVQNFSADVSPKKSAVVDDVRIDNMWSGIPEFKEGNWKMFFTSSPPHPKVQPGQSIKLKLSSSSPPGIVLCRAGGGSFVMKGVGEDMPAELEALLPRYEILPTGYTIGPVDNLKQSPMPEKISYLQKSLPRCRQQGWMTEHTFMAYNQLLKQNNLQAILARIANDLKTDSITTEVFAIINGMKE